MANENILILILFLLFFIMTTGYLIILILALIKEYKRIELIKKEIEHLVQEVLETSTEVNKDTLYLYKKMVKIHEEIFNR